MGIPGVCIKCGRKAFYTRIFYRYDGKNWKAGDEIHYRCGWIGFCIDCLIHVKKKHPDLIYKTINEIGTKEQILEKLRESDNDGVKIIFRVK